MAADASEQDPLVVHVGEDAVLQQPGGEGAAESGVRGWPQTHQGRVCQH